MVPDLEARVEALNKQYIETLSSLARSDFIREGVLREALTGLIWGIYDEMPDQRTALADATDNWPDLIKQAIKEEQGRPKSSED